MIPEFTEDGFLPEGIRRYFEFFQSTRGGLRVGMVEIEL